MADEEKTTKRASEARGGTKSPRGRKTEPSATKAVAKKTAAPKTPVKRAVARPITRTVTPRAAKPERAGPVEAPAPKPKAEPRPLPTAAAGHAPLIDASGAVTGDLALPEALAAVKRRAGVLFQALTAAASNAHLGTAATKNRSRVSGGGAKPWRQKGTGRARQGSTRAPHWRHGGVVFGPNGRRYHQRAPEKMRREAFAEAFAARAGEGRVLVYEGLTFDEGTPRTRTVVEWLDKIGDAGRVLFVTPEVDEQIARATANAPDTRVRSVGTLRTNDLLTHDTLIVRRDALDALAARAHTEKAEATA
ncbi:MAG: 50S ribosomal protein L4 [Chloroflexota bacterium]|nr:50S ribosomal protein L4 [Chloroflexota bacterium]MDE3194623.1 50S ribosomal protein L4 [Chloroflexota bacterium]